jgi:hypothetical protein
MTEPKYKFIQLSEGASTKDGQKTKVRIVAEGTKPLTIEMPYQEIPNIIHYFVQIAVDAARKRGDAYSFDGKPSLEFVPIQADQIGLKAGRTNDSVAFVVKIADLDLVFEFPVEQLRGMGEAVSRIAATLGSGPKSVN